MRAPVPLDATHGIAGFHCGQALLDDWLQKRALAAMEQGTARTYVVCAEKSVVAGYFSLAAGAVEHARASSSLRRNTPDPIPVIILARLAVALSHQSRGIGSALLAEAMKRAVQASRIIGARALVVHALDLKAAEFYSAHGFRKMADETYFIAMKTIAVAL